MEIRNGSGSRKDRRSGDRTRRRRRLWPRRGSLGLPISELMRRGRRRRTRSDRERTSNWARWHRCRPICGRSEPVASIDECTGVCRCQHRAHCRAGSRGQAQHSERVARDECYRPRVERPDLDDQARGQGDPSSQRSLKAQQAKIEDLTGTRHSARGPTRAARPELR